MFNQVDGCILANGINRMVSRKGKFSLDIVSYWLGCTELVQDIRYRLGKYYFRTSYLSHPFQYIKCTCDYTVDIIIGVIPPHSCWHCTGEMKYNIYLLWQFPERFFIPNVYGIIRYSMFFKESIV